MNFNAKDLLSMCKGLELYITDKNENSEQGEGYLKSRMLEMSAGENLYISVFVAFTDESHRARGKENWDCIVRFNSFDPANSTPYDITAATGYLGTCEFLNMLKNTVSFDVTSDDLADFENAIKWLFFED